MTTSPPSPDPEPAEGHYFENADEYLCPISIARLIRKIAGLIRKSVEHPLILFFIFGFVMIICGIAGFSEYYASEYYADKLESNAGISDFIYQTLQLFVLQSQLVIQPPLLLEIARFGAAVFVALAFVSLLLSLFWEQVQSFRLLISFQPKAIICGLGYLGPLYVQEFRRRGYRTVVIEKDPAYTSAELPGTGIFFIKGDATNPAILRRVHIRQSDIMVLVTGDDLTNIQISMAAIKTVKSKKPRAGSFLNSDSSTSKKPIFLIHIVDRWLDNALRLRFVPLHKDNPSLFFHFNMYTRAAKKLVPYIWQDITKNKPEGEMSTGFHILLIGLGTMGEEISKQFIERWKDVIANQPHSKSILTYTFVDYKEAGEKAKRLQQWIEEMKYPADNILIRYYPYKVPSAEFFDGKFLKDDPEGRPVPPVSAVIICLANQTLAMTTALEIVPIIKKNLENSSSVIQSLPPVYIRFIRNDEITNFIHLLKKQAPFSILFPYTVAEYGAFWNEELDKKFPEKPCKFLMFCPFECKKKIVKTINP